MEFYLSSNAETLSLMAAAALAGDSWQEIPNEFALLDKSISISIDGSDEQADICQSANEDNR